MIRASELKLANRLVSQLREANGQVQIDPDELVTLIRAAQSVISAQPVMVELTVPVKIVGDVHGQFEDLRRIFDRCGWPPIHNYLFLGDYVDRGNHQIETISLLLALKVLHPNKLFLLRGNHECPEVNRFYGFLDELQRRGYGQRFYRLFNVSSNGCRSAVLSVLS